MLAALDTNILLYAEGLNGTEREGQARALLNDIAGQVILIPGLVLGEFYDVLSRRGGRSRAEARSATLVWQTNLPVLGLTAAALEAGIQLAAAHQLQVWDAAILATAAEAECAVLLSEDMQHGFHWRGVTVVNPFTHPEHPLLARLLD